MTRSLPSWLHWLETCNSTNTWAIAHADKLQHGAVVFTRRQTAGRGQQGRSWDSPPGVLTASFVLDRLPVAQLPSFNLAAGLAVIYAVEDLLPELQQQLTLKWPNDVYLRDRKVAGILTEMVRRNRATGSRAIVGIGLNRCAQFTPVDRENLQQRAISLGDVADSVPDELALLEQLRAYLLQAAGVLMQPKLGLKALLPEIRRRDLLCHRAITLELNENRIVGEAAGIDALGRLLLRLPDQELQAFASGRVLI